MCLLEALESGSYQRGIFGTQRRRGGRLRKFYTSGGLDKYLSHGDRVEILTLEAFVARRQIQENFKMA